MKEYQIKSWKHGGLVVETRYKIKATKRSKTKNVGEMSTWSAIKWPTAQGLMLCMTNLLTEDDVNFGSANDVDQLRDIHDNFLQRQDELITVVVEALKTGGVIRR